MPLIPGSYEAILTHRLQEALQGLDHAWSHQVEKLESAERQIVWLCIYPESLKKSLLPCQVISV